MANYFDRFDAPKEQPKNFFDQFDPKPKEEPSGTLRQIADVPVGFTKGIASGIRMLTDVFGADNPASRALKNTEEYLTSLMSAQARNDQAEIAKIMKDAEDKGVLDQVMAGVKAFATAPVDMLTQAAGTAVPVIAGGLAGTIAKIAPRVIGAGIGAGMGTGVVKGTIYEETKKALVDAGVPEDQAEARAELAQSYGGKNLDQILLGTALGGLTSVVGVEPAAVGAITRRILGKEVAEEAGKEAAKRVAKEAGKSVARRAAETGLAEAAPEFLQAAQEQVAANIAQQREGLDVDTLRGAVGAGTLEALAGAGLGAGVGAVTGRAEKPEAKPVEEELPRQEVKTTNFRTIDPTGAEVTVQVTEDPNTGEITAVGPDGETVDLIPFMGAGKTVADAVKDAFADEDAPTPAPIVQTAPKEEIPEEKGEVAGEPKKAPETPSVTEKPITEIPKESAPEPVTPKVKPPFVEEEPQPVTKLSEFPSFEERLSYYFTNNPSATRDDVVIFDDRIFYKSPEGRYTDSPTGKDYDASFDNLGQIQKALNDQYDGTPLEDTLIPPEYFDRYKKLSEPTTAAEPVAPKPVAPEPTPEIKKREISGTPVQVKKAESFAKKELGEVVYQDGDLFMYRRYNPKDGSVEYPVRLGNKQLAKDVFYYRGREIDNDTQVKLSNVRRDMEAESRQLEKTSPFMTFDQSGLGMSEDVDPRIKGIVSQWKDLLGLKGNVYIATDEFVNKNYNKFVGDERNIVGMVRKKTRGGATQKLRNGNRIVFFRKENSTTLTLETLAHELGHIHEEQVYNQADQATKDALRKAHAEWVMKTTGKTIAEFIPSLRGRAISKSTLGKMVSPETIPADRLDRAYWKSFSEWYADQVSRWAVSQEKPVGIVEQFFARLGKAMRAFYQQLKNAGYLPNETFARYLDNVTKKVDLTPPELEAEPTEVEPPKEMVEPEIKEKKLPPGRAPELAEAAKKIETGEVTAEEYDALVNQYRPIRTRDEVRTPNTKDELSEALNVTQREKISPSIAANTPVGLRLDIVATNKGVPAITIHTARGGGPFSKSVGKVIGFDSVAKLRDVFFAPGDSKEALEIAKGRKKEPLQTMEGRWVKTTPEQAVAEAQDALQSKDWIQVGVDPTRHAYFYDKKTTEPVIFAEEVIQIGDQVFAKNVQYAQKGDYLFSDQDAKVVAGRSAELNQAAKDLMAGKISAKEYGDLVNQYKPIRAANQVREPNTEAQMVEALKSDQRGKVNPDIKDNDPVGTRLDIEATKKGVPVVTIHEPKPNPGSPKQPIVGYGSVAKLRDVFFAPGNQKRALAVAAGAYKEPLQTIEGRWINITPEKAYEEAKEALRSNDWVQVGVDPTRHAYFYDKSNTRPVVTAEEIIQIGDQVFAKNVQYADPEEFLYLEKADPISVGKSAVETIKRLGREEKPDPTRLEKIKGVFVDDQGNVKLTKEEAKKQVRQFLDRVQTWAFSTDAAMNNAIRRIVMDTTKSDEEKFGLLLSISTSQTVHADAVASLFMRYGGIKYNDKTYKYEAVDKKDNLISLVKGVEILSSKYGMTKEQAERVAHTAFEAKRLRSLVSFNESVDAEMSAIKKRIKKAKEDGNMEGVQLGNAALAKARKKKKFIHMTEEEIGDGLRLLEMMPELNDIVDTWNGMRQSAIDQLVKDGLWSEEEAESMMENLDYVPFYREDQLEKGKGPKEYLGRLQVQAKEKRLKGSMLPVNDIFDNMARWTQYAIKRSVMNRMALTKIDVAVDFGLATKVDEDYKGANKVRVWRDGKPEYYAMSDPMFMEAFAGLEPVAIPTWKFAAKISNFLRQSVVLYPLFSIAQLPQDSFAAMFSSGLKPRFALTIPARAVKEFLKTLAKRSQTHAQLERIGAVGIKDFSAQIARNDAEITAGLKAPPGVIGKAKDFLEHFSMASDNAVRQAVYEASMAQASAGGRKPTSIDQAKAYERAFQLINFRARGSSKLLNMMGQVIPFFNAYLAAQHVAIKVISGTGIAPETRKDALQTLVWTTAAITALSLVYAMTMDDDEEYVNKPSVMRDRVFMVPGTSMTIPIRQDIFSIPKIITEHTYMMMTNQGATDGRKFRDSMKAALGNALFSPTVVPQAIKPLVEVGINYSFFQGRPLIGTYQKGLDVERQFNDSTSELAKILGQTGVISPIAADHLIRGMFGSVGGLVLYMTNPMLDSFGGVERPDMSVQDMIATLPGTSGFVSKSAETGLKNDFYVLRDEVSKAVNTLNDIKRRSPEDIEEFLSKEENVKLVSMQGITNRITQQLTNIRSAISTISNLPSSQMSSEEKAREIKELRKAEEEMLRAVNVKELRNIAGL